MAYGFLLLWLITLLYFVVAIFFFFKNRNAKQKKVARGVAFFGYSELFILFD